MPSESAPIKVFGKVRGLSSKEVKNGNGIVARADRGKIIIDVAAKESSFSFDGSYSEDTKTLFKECCQPLVRRLLEGYNTAVVALGATGSGKTRLFQGCADDSGLTSLMIREIFADLSAKSSTKDVFVSCTFAEYDDDSITDLLNPHDREMAVRQHPQLGIYVEGLSELTVTSSDDLEQYYSQGCRARRVADSELRGHKLTSSAVFTVHVEQREKGSDVGRRAKLVLVDSAGLDLAEFGTNSSKSMQALSAVITGLKQKKHVPYRNSQLTRALQEPLGGSCVTVVVACVASADVHGKTSVDVLEKITQLKGVKNQAWVNMDDVNHILDELREEIARLRNKMSSSPTTSKEDVEKLEDLLRDLNTAKRQTWEERERLSKHYIQERPASLANKGVVDWVLGAMEDGQREHREKMTQLSQDEELLKNQYKGKRATVEQLKDDLKEKIEAYSKLAERGKASESETKKKVSAIHEAKERLKKEQEQLRELKQRIRDTQEQKRMQKQEAQASYMALKGNFETRQIVEEEERRRQESEHKQMLTEELEKMRLDIEHEKADIQIKVSQGRQYSTEEGIALEEQLVELKAEKAVMTLKLQTLEQEKAQLSRDLSGAYRRHGEELELQQLQHFETFREYRSVFESQKAALEERWRTLVEDSVRDAIYLSAAQSELQTENRALRQQIAELKDQVQSLGGMPADASEA